MNRKEFLQTSASLIPMSLLGTSAAQAATSAAPMAAPVSYLERHGKDRDNFQHSKLNRDNFQ